MLTNNNEEEKARCYNSTTHDPIERCPRHVTHLTRRLRSRWRELLVISPRSQFLKITWFGLWTQCKHYTVFADMMQRARCKTQRKNYEGAKRSYSARTQYWTIFGFDLIPHSIINVSLRVLIVKTARNKKKFLNHCLLKQSQQKSWNITNYKLGIFMKLWRSVWWPL